jgi:hypothetical protein
LAELERLECERETPGVDLFEVEEVVDQRGETLRFPVNGVEVAPARILVELTLEEELDEAEHARKRRSQLVRDGRNELGLALRRLAHCAAITFRHPQATGRDAALSRSRGAQANLPSPAGVWAIASASVG